MKDRRDRDSGSENYHFIKETIKERTFDKKVFLKRALACAAGGMVFGCCAVFAFAALLPWAVEKLGAPDEKKVNVELSGTPEFSESKPSSEPVSATEAPETEEVLSENLIDSEEENTEIVSPLQEYEKIYESVLKIAEEPRKALVSVSGISEDENLLDHSFLHYGEEEGILFLENEKDLYVLTGMKDIEDAELIQVTFSNGSFAMGEMCKADEETGLAVIRVPKVRLSERTLDEISIASLGDSDNLYLARPVIAIGTLMGDYDGVVYGMVTSISGKVSVADGEYSQIITDMQGSSDSDGVLLDTAGNVIGIIMQSESEDINFIKAVSVAQLRPLIEILCNGDTINYLGIYGTTISETQADSLGVPQGIYVDNIETDSPAMIAGIQSGDIITGVGGETVEDMQSYMDILQNKKAGQKTEISLVRRSASDGSYVEMNFELIIEDR